MAFALPSFLNMYLGDAIWALMVYFILGFVFPRLPIYLTALGSLLFCFSVEISQLYQAEWINQLRHTFIGALVLGFGFLWTDLIAYSIGILSGLLLEWYFLWVFKQDVH
jgi:hypothetical protein